MEVSTCAKSDSCSMPLIGMIHHSCLKKQQMQQSNQEKQQQSLIGTTTRTVTFADLSSSTHKSKTISFSLQNNKADLSAHSPTCSLSRAVASLQRYPRPTSSTMKRQEPLEEKRHVKLQDEQTTTIGLPTATTFDNNRVSVHDIFSREVNVRQNEYMLEYLRIKRENCPILCYESDDDDEDELKEEIDSLDKEAMTATSLATANSMNNEDALLTIPFSVNKYSSMDTTLQPRPKVNFMTQNTNSYIFALQNQFNARRIDLIATNVRSLKSQQTLYYHTRDNDLTSPYTAVTSATVGNINISNVENNLYKSPQVCSSPEQQYKSAE